MAFGMKAWLGFVAVLLLLVAIWGGSPVPDLSMRRTVLPERQKYMELAAELRQDARLYKRIYRRDTLVAELASLISGGNTLVLGLPAVAADSARDLLTLAVDLQLRDLDLPRPKSTVHQLAWPKGPIRLSVSLNSPFEI